MCPSALYVLGAPATGKTTVLHAWIDRMGMRPDPEPIRLWRTLIGHILLGGPGGLYLGRLRDRFSGTDGLSMAVAPDATLWVQEVAPTMGEVIICGEGARLGTVGFLRAMAQKMPLTLVLLHADGETLAARCAERSSHQDEGWRAGAATRARNAFHGAEPYAERAVSVDARQSVAAIVEEIGR